MICQHAQIPPLLTNDFCRGILDDSRTMQLWLPIRSNEILKSLANSPDARISLPRGPEELNHLGGKNGRIEQRPAFIENCDAHLTAAAGASLRHSISDQHAHRGLQAGIIAQSLDIEEQPR